MKQLIIILATTLICLFLVACASQAEMEIMQQSVIDSQATAVTETNLRSTAEAALSNQQIEATRMAETAVTNETTLVDTLTEIQKQQASLESEFYAQQENTHAHQLALASYQGRENTHPDWQLSALLAVEAVNHVATAETIASLADSLKRLAELDIKMEGLHQDATEMVFSQDSSSLLSWSWGKEAVLWDVSTGEEIFSIPIQGEGRGLSNDGCYFAVENWPSFDVIDMCHGEVVFTTPLGFWAAAAFSPDNQLLAYSTTDLFAIQNLQSGEDLFKEKIPPFAEDFSESYDAIAFNKDGSLVAGANFRELHIWDVNTGQVTTIFTHSVGRPEKLIFSPDNEYLLLAGFEDATLWNLSSNTEIPIESLPGISRSIQFSPDNRHLLITRQMHEERGEGGNWYQGEDVTQVWELETYTEILRVNGASLGAAFLEDSNQLNVILNDGTIQQWDVDQHRLIASSAVNPSNATAINSNGTMIATNDGDSVYLWKPPAFSAELTLQPSDHSLDTVVPDGLQTVAFSPESTLLATAGVYGDVRLWNTNTGHEEGWFLADGESYTGSPNVLSFSPDGTALLSGNGNLSSPAPDWEELGSTNIWNLANSNAVTLTHGAWVTNIVFEPNGRYFVTASDKAEVWSLNGDLISTCLPNQPSLDIAISPDDQQLVVLTPNLIGFCNMQTGEVLAQITPPDNGVFETMALSDNGRLLAVGEGQVIHVWDLQTSKLITDITTELPLDKLAFSANAQYLGSRNHNEYRNGYIEVWETESWQPLIKKPHSFGDFSFSPDSTAFAFGDQSQLAQVLSLPDGQEINHIQHEEPIDQVVFSPDGKQLALKGGWETVLLWHWHSDDLIAETCQRLTRNLTPEEWQTYLNDEPYRPTCPNLASEN